MNRRVVLPSVLLVVGALSLAACGEDDREGSFTSESGTGTETTGTGTEATTTPSGEVSQKLEISEVEFSLDPANFSIAQPGVVQFLVKNDGGTVHALEVEGATGEFETEEIQPGQQVRLRADVTEAGTYKLYCPIGNHEAQGMVGKLVVGGGGAGEDSGGGEDGGGEDDTGEDDSGGAAPPRY